MTIEVTEVQKEKAGQPVMNNDELIKQMQIEIKTLKEKAEKSAPVSDTSAVLTELVNQLKEKPDSEKYCGGNAYVKQEDIDPEDQLEQGVTFFCHQTGHVIVDDKRQGHPVRTPFGEPILFQYQSTKSVKTGRETKLQTLSAYTSWSKMEVNWLKEHSLFGSMFFENHQHALSMDGRRAAILAQMMITLNTYEPHKINKIAKQNGIPASIDVAGLRLAIAIQQADKQIVAEDEANQIRLKKTLIEEEVIPLKQV